MYIHTYKSMMMHVLACASVYRAGEGSQHPSTVSTMFPSYWRGNCLSHAPSGAYTRHSRTSNVIAMAFCS